MDDENACNVSPEPGDAKKDPNECSWRKAPRLEIRQDQRSYRNFSSCRNYSDKNSVRNDGSTTTDGNRRNTNQNKPRPTIGSNWRLKEGASSNNCCESDTASHEHITKERYYEGSWAFRVTDEEKENLIEVLQQLHNDNPSLFVKPPSQMGKKKKGLTVIECPTADSRDVDTVRNVAKIIHNVVDHPYGVYYYHRGVGRYFFLQDALFQSVKRENSIVWISIEEKTPSSITDQINNISLDDKDCNSTDLPSKVTDSMCLFHPSESTLENLPSQAGKWMLYGSKDLLKMDSYWKKLKLLCGKGVLAALKSSTAADERGGVIRAYTNDCENMEEVSLAGKAIIEETGYSELMFYKSNEASKKGAYVHEGKQSVSLYLHAGKSNFCLKDKYNRWKLWQEM